jgi:hypothetical protein
MRCLEAVSTEEGLLHNAQQHPSKTRRGVLNRYWENRQSRLRSERFCRNDQKAGQQNLRCLRIPIITPKRTMTQATGTPTIIRSLSGLFRRRITVSGMMAATTLKC